MAKTPKFPEGMQDLLDKLEVVKRELEIHKLRGVALNDKRSELQHAIKQMCPHPDEYLKKRITIL